MTLSYVSGISTAPLVGRTIGAELDRVTAEHGDREALVSVAQGLRYTYREFHAAVEEAARAFLAIGVGTGDRVGIWSPNNAEWIIVQYATAKVGAILVNINPAYRRRELQYALEQSGVSVLVTAVGFRDAGYLEMLADVRGELPDLQRVIVLGEADDGNQSWDDFLAGADDVDTEALREREATLDFDDAINIQYTSGTTGAPKGATLTHHNILNNGWFIAQRMQLTEDDRVCLPVPLYHCFGMVLGNLTFLTRGGCIVLPGEAFEPAAALAAVEAESCTALYGVPTMFIAELDLDDFDDYDLATLRTGIMAGSSCPVEVMKQVIDRMHMAEVTIAYGMTETSPVSFQSTVDDDLEHRTGTVGAIHPHVEVKVIDPDGGRTVVRGEPGELCTRGYNVMLGYWNNPEATADAIDASRWMHTGDLAVMHDDGYVNIIGRIKDMVIRGGDNLYPREIEEYLYTHPKVSDVAVIGVPDDKYGEELCAWIQLREGEEATEDELRDFCRGEIASNKIPRYIRFSDEFPMTVTGKIRKVEMRETSTRELGLEDAAATRTA